MARHAADLEALALPGERGWSGEDLRRLQILSARLVTGSFAGDYQSVFRGRGVEFEEVREYQPGDDIRTIDWNVTARAGRPFVKRFVQERELTVMLLLDLSPSLDCPSRRGTKSALAAEVCALLAFAAARSNDRVGLLTCTDRVEEYLPPAKGVSHAQRIAAACSLRRRKGEGTDIGAALGYLDRVTRRSATLCIVSDFLADGFGSPLCAVARRHDTVAVVVTDPRDLQLPEGGLLQVADPETGRRRMIDSASPLVREAYQRGALAKRRELLATFAAAGVDSLEICTGSSPLQALQRFFKGRQRRGRGGR